MTRKQAFLLAAHLSVDLLSEGRAELGGGLRWWRARSWLHGDQLYFVGLAPGAVRRATGQTINMVKDGGRGQELIWSTA